MEKYVFTKTESLPKEVCQKIIEEFYAEDIHMHKYSGVTRSGLAATTKDTTDLQINRLQSIPFWKNVSTLLRAELESNLVMYLQSLNITWPKSIIDELIIPVFQMQKYNANRGKYIKHQDYAADLSKQRIITYIWYLNDVTEGGQTTFWNDDLKIQPTAGTLLFFPALPVFDHCGKMPISDDKYIITGWIYEPLKLIEIPANPSDTL